MNAVITARRLLHVLNQKNLDELDQLVNNASEKKFEDIDELLDGLDQIIDNESLGDLNVPNIADINPEHLEKLKELGVEVDEFTPDVEDDDNASDSDSGFIEKDSDETADDDDFEPTTEDSDESSEEAEKADHPDTDNE